MALAPNNAHPLLLACMRGEPLKPSGSLDWPRLLTEARDHGLLTRLHESLIASGIAVPDFFREAAIAQWASAQILTAGLESTLDALKGIDVMPLKGPMLAEELYGDPALRPSNDIDLLVRKEDFARAESLLFGHEFRAEGEADDYHRVFEHGKITVELHYGLDSSRGSNLDVDQIWRRATEAEFHDRPIQAMSLEDRAIYLCLHGLKHGFTRLIWIDDVARSVRAASPAALFDMARTGCMELPLAVACEVAGAALGLPSEVENELARYSQRTQAQHAARQLLNGIMHTMENPEIWSISLQMETGTLQRWRRRLSVFTPTVKDRRWAERHGVPLVLTPATRPIRLLRKYGFVRAWRTLFP